MRLKKKKQIMKTVYGCFEKGLGTHEKKIIFKNKIETDVPNKKKFCWGPRILFYKYENSFAKVCTKQTSFFFFFFYIYLNKFLLRLSK